MHDRAQSPSQASAAARMRTIMHIDRATQSFATAIGAQIRARRRELGLDQSELALVSGVSRRTIHALEHGKPTAQLAALVPVLRALGLELEAAPRQTTRASRPVR